MERRHFISAGTRAAAAFGALRYLGACAPAATGGAGNSGSSPAFRALRDRYFVRTLTYNPVTATYLGGDAYDPALADVNARLRDYRASALASELSFYRETADALRTLSPAPAGSTEAVDRAVLAAQLAFLVRLIGERRYHERSIDTYVAEPFRGVDWQMQQMTAFADGALGTEAEWELLVRRVSAVPAYLETARANLLAGKAAGNLPDRRMVERDGVAGSESNARYFRETLSATAAGFLGARPFAARLRDEIARAGGRAGDAFGGFAEFLKRTYDTGDQVDRFPAGEEEYNWRLRTCLHEPRSAAELWTYGAEQVATYEGRLFQVAAEISQAAGLDLAFGSDAEKRAGVRAVIEHLSREAPRDDDELLRWYVETGARAVEYGRRREMFDVPAEYRLDVVSTPPVLRSSIDAAYYPAPPFKKSGVGRFYLSPTGNDPAALQQNNRPSVATTAIHEGFPGHDWHFKFMTAHADAISNIRWLTPGAVEDSSAMWQDSMATEGWALYAEELMAEPAEGRRYGFYTPAEYLYMLQAQLMRSVRVRVDVGIHTGRMSFDEAVDYFAEHVEFVPGAATRAATEPAARAAYNTADRAIYRYSKWPTQAITYNLGKNAIVRLRDDYKARRGNAFSAREFHERLMMQGTIAAGYVRDALLTAG